MRILKTLIAVLIISLIVVGAVGCKTSSTAATTAASKQVKVTLGTISNAVTGTATLDLAKTQDLSFEMAGFVDQILVLASDSVTKGQQLATLDTSTWQDSIHSLQESLSSAQRNFNNKQFALTVAKRAIDTKTLSKQQADLSLRTAQETLANIDDVKAAQTALDTINNDIAFAETSRRAALAVGDTTLAEQWVAQLRYLNDSLNAVPGKPGDPVGAQYRLDQVLKGSGVSATNVALQIAQDVFAVTQAQKAVNDAQTAIDDAQVSIDNAQLDVNDAQSSVSDAQTKLSDQQALSPIITAPFDGFIPSIKVAGGDQVYKGSVAMQIADPNQFEASFMVSETDIFSVSVGQAAVVSVDALNGETFPAKVTAIAPLATVSSGVVNYKVTAELTSLIPITSNFTAAGAATGSAGSATSTRVRPSGFPTGTRPSGIPTVTPASDTGTVSGSVGSAPATVAATAATLKQGLSASVTITIQEKKNVLIVPNRAVTVAAGKSTVQVVEGTVTNTVDVTTGLSDATNIEIASGLTAGQIVLVKASGTASTSAFGPGGGALRIP